MKNPKKNPKKHPMSGSLRTCYVNGRRALFHRWADSAHPVAPLGLAEAETASRFQYWGVRGLVEYEDGTMDRVWPNEITFTDGGAFADYYWPEVQT